MLNGFIYLTLAALMSVSLGCDLELNIDCSSINYQNIRCAVSGTSSHNLVSVVSRYSESLCTLGTSYGFDQGAIWVDNGCRAKFHLCSCNNYKLVDCDSNNYAYNTCLVAGASRVTYVDVETKKSTSGCTLNSSYGITGASVWVNNGCRASFHVCYA